jgi:transposase
VSKARLVINAVVVQGLGVRETTRTYNVSPGWVSRLLARYRAEGEAAFQPRSRRPHSQPTAISMATAELIIRLRHQLAGQGLDAGAHTIAWHLDQQHQLSVSEATIWRTLQRAGLITQSRRRNRKQHSSPLPLSSPMKCGKPTSPITRLICPDGSPGADVEILCFIDDHSRYAISVTCHHRVTGPAVVAAFREAVTDQGIPASVLSDNGMVFTTRFSGGHAGRDTLNGFQAELRHLGVIEKHSRPNQPHHLRQSRTVPTDPEEVAQGPAAAAHHDRRAASPLRHLCCLLQQLPAAPLPEPPHPAAYQARPKASPAASPPAEPQARVRRDIIDADGKLTLRHNGRLHHIGIGRTHARTPILMLINGRHIRIIHATTGELIRELELNPAVDYQALDVRKPRPKPR